VGLADLADLGAKTAQWEPHGIGVLEPDLVIPRLGANDKIGAIKELVDRLRQQDVIGDSLQFLQSVLARESLQSTIVEDGVALPHARCHAVNRLGLAVGIARPPLEYPSGDELREIPVICLIAVPAQSPALYLSLMASLVRCLRDPAVRMGLQAAVTVEEIQELLSWPDHTLGTSCSQRKTL
jgi:mannitol/fructose-specific phosphotransferase system IIA component (Ntr-type)